jgi:hypothetical protein
MTLTLWSGSASGQEKPACDQQGCVMTPQKVEGQVVKVDAARNKQGLANLREAPKCP